MEGIDQSSSGQQTSVKTEKAVEAVDIKTLLAMGDLAHGEKVLKNVQLAIWLQRTEKTKSALIFGV